LALAYIPTTFYLWLIFCLIQGWREYPEEMKTPPGAMPDEFEVTYNLKNKKQSETKTMTDKEYLKSGYMERCQLGSTGQPRKPPG
jgi:hypothetical protein